MKSKLYADLFAPWPRKKRGSADQRHARRVAERNRYMPGICKVLDMEYKPMKQEG